MQCGVCNKKVLKDIKIDDIQTCYTCRKIWIDAFHKMRKYAIKHKDDLQY